MNNSHAESLVLQMVDVINKMKEDVDRGRIEVSVLMNYILAMASLINLLNQLKAPSK